MILRFIFSPLNCNSISTAVPLHRLGFQASSKNTFLSRYSARGHCQAYKFSVRRFFKSKKHYSQCAKESLWMSDPTEIHCAQFILMDFFMIPRRRHRLKQKKATFKSNFRRPR